MSSADCFTVATLKCTCDSAKVYAVQKIEENYSILISFLLVEFIGTMQPHLRIVFLFLFGLIYRNICGFPAAADDDSDDVIDLSGYALKYGLPDMESGQMVNNWQPSDPWNPEELGNYFEGDILMPKTSSSARNGLKGESYRWPNGIIPFEIKGNFDSQSLSLIQKAMDTYHQKTCIKFQRRTPKDKDYISIQNSQSGCFSSIGRVGGAQTVSVHS